jgi:hypothetical protein
LFFEKEKKKKYFCLGLKKRNSKSNKNQNGKEFLKYCTRDWHTSSSETGGRK